MMVDVPIMCTAFDCPLRSTCRRHEASGTRPSDRQNWTEFDWELGDDTVWCDAYLPTGVRDDG